MTNKDIWLYLKSKSGGGESTNAFTVFNASVTNNKITINGLVDKMTVGNIEIPAKIEGASVTTIDAYAFKDCSSLNAITIPNSVTAIRYNAFENCSSLNAITIPDSVTSIGGNAFVNCSSLMLVTIPNSVTSIGNYAFVGCGNLSDVILEDNFNCNNLNLAVSAKYSVDTLVGILNALKDRTGETAYTLTLGTTNLAKLTDEDIAIATAKNWTLA